MKTLNPYLSLNGHAREAMNFYKTCFGGDLSFLTVGESPMAADTPPEKQNEVMHSALVLGNGITLMATDMTGPGGDPNRINGSIAIDCDSEDEINRIFDTLSVGGSVMCPVGPAFWGGLFASTSDKYGVNWMLAFSK